MAFTVIELDNRRTTNDDPLRPRATLAFQVSGRADIPSSDEDADARAAVLAAAPSTYQGMPIQDTTLQGVGHYLWEAEVFYAFDTAELQSRPETGSPTFSFDTTGATQRITQSLETINSTAPTGETPPDYGGAIGVSADSVEGVDIVVPQMLFTETHIRDDGDITDAYKRKVTEITGSTNDAIFRGYQIGEVLFLGAQGFRRDGGDWEITYRFAASINKTGIVIGDLDPIDKKGWEYLWVRYEDAEDATAGKLVKKPVAAYTERVYEEASFATDLGI